MECRRCAGKGQRVDDKVPCYECQGKGHKYIKLSQLKEYFEQFGGLKFWRTGDTPTTRPSDEIGKHTTLKK